MSLRVWLPLNGDLHNQGLGNITVTSGTSNFKTNGKIGSCFDLNTQINFTCPQLVNIQTFSIAFWAKVNADTSLSANWVDVIGFTDATSSGTTGQLRWETCYGSGYETRGISSHDNTTNAISNSFGAILGAEKGKWYHIACTVDIANNEIKEYSNGVLVRTITPNGGHLTGVFWIGQANVVNGELNDVRIYDHALSAKEVEEIAKGLVLHYKLDDNGLGNINLALNSYQLDKASSKTNLYIYPRGAGTRQLRNDGFYEVKCTASWQGFSFWANALNLTVGTKLTYSFYIYGNGSSRAFSLYPMMFNSAGTRDTTTKLPISCDGENYVSANARAFTPTTATEPEFHYVTFEWSQGVADIISNGGSIELSIQVHGTWNTGDWACVFAPKLEYGEVATRWSPAPADLGLDTSIIYDCSGYQNNGHINGTININPGGPKYSSFSQLSAATTISHSRCLDNTNQEWTCVAWVKPAAAGNYQNLNNFNSNNRLYHDTYPLLYLNSGTNDYYNYGNMALPANEWSHIAFVFKNSTGTKLIYINGENHTNMNGPNKTSTPAGIPDTIIIGSSYEGGLCDYREYATALTSEQIKELYNTSMSIDNNGNIYARELVEK